MLLPYALAAVITEADSLRNARRNVTLGASISLSNMDSLLGRFDGLFSGSHYRLGDLRTREPHVIGFCYNCNIRDVTFANITLAGSGRSSFFGDAINLTLSNVVFDGITIEGTDGSLIHTVYSGFVVTGCAVDVVFETQGSQALIEDAVAYGGNVQLIDATVVNMWLSSVRGRIVGSLNRDISINGTQIDCVQGRLANTLVIAPQSASSATLVFNNSHLKILIQERTQVELGGSQFDRSLLTVLRWALGGADIPDVSLDGVALRSTAVVLYGVGLAGVPPDAADGSYVCCINPPQGAGTCTDSVESCQTKGEGLANNESWLLLPDGAGSWSGVTLKTSVLFNEPFGNLETPAVDKDDYEHNACRESFAGELCRLCVHNAFRWGVSNCSRLLDGYNGRCFYENDTVRCESCDEGYRIAEGGRNCYADECYNDCSGIGECVEDSENRRYACACMEGYDATMGCGGCSQHYYNISGHCSRLVNQLNGECYMVLGNVQCLQCDDGFELQFGLCVERQGPAIAILATVLVVVLTTAVVVIVFYVRYFRRFRPNNYLKYTVAHTEGDAAWQPNGQYLVGIDRYAQEAALQLSVVDDRGGRHE